MPFMSCPAQVGASLSIRLIDILDAYNLLIRLIAWRCGRRSIAGRGQPPTRSVRRAPANRSAASTFIDGVLSNCGWRNDASRSGSTLTEATHESGRSILPIDGFDLYDRDLLYIDCSAVLGARYPPAARGRFRSGSLPVVDRESPNDP
jgi:hypothetical protein